MRDKLHGRTLLLFAVAAVPVVLASAAFACQSTVTLYASPTTVAAGSSVQVTGNKYNSSTSFGPVEIRLDSRTAPVLATAQPAGGNINVSVPIPAKTTAGYHILIATQYNKTTGAPCTGCPGRTSIRVTAPTTAAAASNGTLGGPGVLTNPLGLVGMGLLALHFGVRRLRAGAAA